jgi:hypothetical protein
MPGGSVNARRISQEVTLGIDTSIADLVWLPIRFEGDITYVDWHHERRIEGRRVDDT